jgi:hypothetical protein
MAADGQLRKTQGAAGKLSFGARHRADRTASTIDQRGAGIDL